MTISVEAIRMLPPFNNLVGISAQLLTGVAGLSDGEWLEIAGLSSISIQIDGFGIAVAQIRGSNKPINPGNTNHEIQMGNDVVENGLFVLGIPIRWVKVRVSSWSSGTFNAYLIGPMAV